MMNKCYRQCCRFFVDHDSNSNAEFNKDNLNCYPELCGCKVKFIIAWFFSISFIHHVSTIKHFLIVNASYADLDLGAGHLSDIPASTNLDGVVHQNHLRLK
jgi:hypothetical protein